MTQTRVRQGLDGVRSLYQKENRLEAQGLAGIDELRPGDQQRHPDAAHRGRPEHSGQPDRRQRLAGKLRRYVPVFEEHAVDHDLLVEGARQPPRLFPVAGIFRSRGASSRSRR